MFETLKTIILDFQQSQLQIGIPRRLAIDSVPGKVTVCIGVRRSGKSTYMFQLIQRLLDSGVSRTNIVYINFFDDRLHNLQHSDINIVAEAYYSLYPEKKNNEKVYYFFDEIQVLPNWESFVDRLIRTEKCEIYLTGSSAQMLSKEIATQMRGRALSWEIFPFSFNEFLDYKNIDDTGHLTTKKRLVIQKSFEEYWLTGGFPEVLGLERHLRIKIHQEYFTVILFRDLIERHDISHPRALTDLAYWLIDHSASFYSLNSLAGYLKSLGHKIHKSLVSDYLEWFEDSYFLFTVRLFDASLARSHANPKKIFCIDHSLVSSVSSGVLVNAGHLLENLVFTALRRRCSNIYYYRTRSNREIDFIVKEQKKSWVMVQVCESLTSPQTKNREISALREGMAEMGIKSGTIVTRNQQDRIETDGGIIDVVPIWYYLLTTV